jgi:hypothetical protein
MFLKGMGGCGDNAVVFLGSWGTTNQQ